MKHNILSFENIICSLQFENYKEVHIICKGELVLQAIEYEVLHNGQNDLLNIKNLSNTLSTTS